MCRRRHPACCWGQHPGFGRSQTRGRSLPPVAPSQGFAGRPSCFPCRPVVAALSSTLPRPRPVTAKPRPCRPPWRFPSRWKGSLNTRRNSPPARARPAAPESFYRVVRAPTERNPIATSSVAATQARRASGLFRVVHQAFCRSRPFAFAGLALPWPNRPFPANPLRQCPNP